MFKITLNYEEYMKEFERLCKIPVSKDVLDRLANKIRNSIIKRTKSGKDVYGKNFKPYSEKYSKAKRKTLVNLTDTGLMLDSIVIESKDKQRTFFFSNREEVAEKHQYGTPPLPRREFFGYGQIPNEQAELKQFWEEEVKKHVKQS